MKNVQEVIAAIYKLNDEIVKLKTGMGSLIKINNSLSERLDALEMSKPKPDEIGEDLPEGEEYVD